MKRSSKAEYDAAIDVLLQLRAAFPEVISRLDLYKRRPLKVGIYQDIRDLFPEIDPAIVSIAMRIYCSDRRYLACLIADAPRVDLTGACCGEVTADEAIRARNYLEYILRRAEAGKAAKEAAKTTESQDKPRPKLSLSGLKAAARARKWNDAHISPDNRIEST
jgi:sRNA-binding protein